VCVVELGCGGGVWCGGDVCGCVVCVWWFFFFFLSLSVGFWVVVLCLYVVGVLSCVVVVGLGGGVGRISA